MNTDAYLRALKSNVILLVVLIAVYALLITGSITLDASPHGAIEVDVVFVFDTTGSMQNKIDSLLGYSSDFARELDMSGADYRLAMVCFRTFEEPPVVRETFPPSDNLADFQNFLSDLRADGGGREAQPDAIRYALDEFTYRENAHRILILVTDEGLLGDESFAPYGYNVDVIERDFDEASAQWDDLVDEIIDGGFTAYSVTVPDDHFVTMADQTGGTFYNVLANRDFTSILQDLVQDIKSRILTE